MSLKPKKKFGFGLMRLPLLNPDDDVSAEAVALKA